MSFSVSTHPLHDAVLKGDLAVIDRLCRKEPSLVHDQVNGRTPLLLAVEKGRVDVSIFLIDQCDSRVEASDDYGRTAVHYASQRGHAAILSFLLHANAITIDAFDKEGKTPLMLAVMGGHVVCVERLLKAGASLEVADKQGNRCFHFAARVGGLDLLEMLVEKGCQMEPRNHQGQTPLHWAAMGGRHENIQALVTSYGLDVNAQDQGLWTSLHWAVKATALDSVKALISLGCDALTLDREGKKASYYASKTTMGAEIEAILQREVKLYHMNVALEGRHRFLQRLKPKHSQGHPTAPPPQAPNHHEEGDIIHDLPPSLVVR